MSIQLPQACHNQHASRGPAGPCCFRFVGRLFGGWIVCEIVQNHRVSATCQRPPVNRKKGSAALGGSP